MGAAKENVVSLVRGVKSHAQSLIKRVKEMKDKKHAIKLEVSLNELSLFIDNFKYKIGDPKTLAIQGLIFSIVPQIRVLNIDINNLKKVATLIKLIKKLKEVSKGPNSVAKL